MFQSFPLDLHSCKSITIIASGQMELMVGVLLLRQLAERCTDECEADLFKERCWLQSMHWVRFQAIQPQKLASLQQGELTPTYTYILSFLYLIMALE